MNALRCVVRVAAVAAAIHLAGCTEPLPDIAQMQRSAGFEALVPAPPPNAVRFAAFNTALSRDTPDALRRALAQPGDMAAARITEVLQRVRPDVVLLSEFDLDPTGRSVEHFRRNYLAVSQNGADPIDYPYAFAPRVNTGEPSGVDLNGDGEVTGPADAYGWGNYPGHYGMLVLSRFPLDVENARSFRLMRWADLPENLIPEGYYSDDARAALRLSSKTHLDLPVSVFTSADDRGNRRAKTVRLLISHPTPPVFDGPEDRNGRRNHDETRLWIDYLHGALLTDDAGVTEPLPPDASFVILGDLNADPFDGDSFGDAINRLIGHPRVNQNRTPDSQGALQADREQAGLNFKHRGHPAHDTADFPDLPPRGPGNLRVDYALPSRDLDLIDAGVFWPPRGHPLGRLANASDHRLVWIDVRAD